MELDRGLPDALDSLENRLAFLFPNRCAEQAPEQSDVVTERHVLLRNLI